MDENLQEFTNPELYDAENKWGADDQFYLELAQQIGGPILDVACGTGRLTRAIAETGLNITGLDIMPTMLTQARKLARHLDIEWVQADCRTMELDRRFRLLLMTSHAFQCLLTDQDQRDFLERAYHNLDSGGVLAFETRNLTGRTYNRSSEKKYAYTFADTQGQWIDVAIASKFDPTTMIDHLQLIRTHRETGKTVYSKIRLRYTELADLNHLLKNQGFTILEQYGDWSKAPFGSSSPEIITVCCK